MKSFLEYLTEKTKPSGNYVSINVDGSVVVPGLIKPTTGIEVPSSEQHVTLMYSADSNIDHAKLLQIIESEFPVAIAVQANEFKTFDDGSIVLSIKSQMLDAIHQRLITLGCTHSYPDYNAHVTLFYKVDELESKVLCKLLNRIVKFPIDIRLAGYKSEPIKTDYVEKL